MANFPNRTFRVRFRSDSENMASIKISTGVCRVQESITLRRRGQLSLKSFSRLYKSEKKDTFRIRSSNEPQNAEKSKDEPKWADPDSGELPPWARNEVKKNSDAPAEIPFFLYLIFSALVSIATVRFSLQTFDYMCLNVNLSNCIYPCYPLRLGQSLSISMKILSLELCIQILLCGPQFSCFLP